MNRVLQHFHQQTKLAKQKIRVGKISFEVELLSDDMTFEVRADVEQFQEDGVSSPSEIERAFDDFFDHVMRKTGLSLDIGRLYGNADVAYCKFRFEADSLLKSI